MHHPIPLYCINLNRLNNYEINQNLWYTSLSVYLQGVQNSADYEIREQMSIGVFCLCCVNFLLKCLTVTYSLLVHDYKQQKDLYKISSLVLHTLKNCFKIHRGGNEAYTKPHTKC